MTNLGHLPEKVRPLVERATSRAGIDSRWLSRILQEYYGGKIRNLVAAHGYDYRDDPATARLVRPTTKGDES